MQFFHLFSFVVVASYAAALPQPAELSEKYSNNVDTNLAFGLEARSYQPRFNSKRDLATLTSLKRRDDSEGPDPSPTSDPTPKETEDPSSTSDPTPKETEDPSFTDSVTNTMNLASKIKQAMDSDFVIFTEGEAVGRKIGGPVGDMVATYFKKDVYIAAIIDQWVDKSVPGLFNLIKSGLGEDKYFEVEPGFTNTRRELRYGFKSGNTKILAYASNIVQDAGTVTYNFQKVNTLLKDFFYDNMEFIRKLRVQMEKFEAGEALKKPLADIVGVVNDFILNQSTLSHKTIKGLDAALFR
ncbi:hypothetical protein BASA60_009711 [Batrachochytrium salamandrivorans]|nr:hypothetical protein BASA60_009711 [Batrachochytrium salamandrivorans]KAH9245021.1 hypothetical protein BASA81_017532 [Batrachochytrium salamandrivorans]